MLYFFEYIIWIGRTEQSGGDTWIADRILNSQFLYRINFWTGNVEQLSDRLLPVIRGPDAMQEPHVGRASPLKRGEALMMPIFFDSK